MHFFFRGGGWVRVRVEGLRFSAPVFCSGGRGLGSGSGSRSGCKGVGLGSGLEFGGASFLGGEGGVGSGFKISREGEGGRGGRGGGVPVQVRVPVRVQNLEGGSSGSGSGSGGACYEKRMGQKYGPLIWTLRVYSRYSGIPGLRAHTRGPWFAPLNLYGFPGLGICTGSFKQIYSRGSPGFL